MSQPGASENREGSGSQHDEAGRCLNARGIEAAEVDYDPRFGSDGSAAEIARGILSSYLGCDDGAGGELVKALAGAFDGKYKDEVEFNIQVFEAMEGCFEAASSKWKVEHYPPKKDRSKKKNPPRLMVITERRTRDAVAETPAATAADGDVKAADQARENAPDIVEQASLLGDRRMTRSSSIRTGASSSSKKKTKKRRRSDQVEEAGGGGERCLLFTPFVAHANHPYADAEREDAPADDGEGNVDEADEGEKTPSQERRLQRSQYAIGLIREAHVPKTKDGIVETDSHLDHALAVLWRDASSPKKRTRGGSLPLGGWAVCQVLATVELKMIDSTCKQFDRVNNGSDTARIDISRIKLSRTGGAGPLGQQLLYAFGHVLWSRAALGLELPPYLPVAVVAAKKAKAGTVDPSKRLRWVYGHLVIPEECGGAFSYNVSSCGAFDGTSAMSAVAVYLRVLMGGLAAGEQWIEKMQQKPPPSDDTRPWPSSMCGRRLYFGGSPLDLLDKKLVATPARMRKLDLPISQGELYKGRVNLEEIRNPSEGKTLRDVVWCQATSKAPSVEAPMSEACALERDTVMETQSRQAESTGHSNSLVSEVDILAKDVVMVKVTSKACHSMLLLPAEALLWNLLKHRRSPEFVTNVLQLVSGSLHAIYRVGDLDSGLVQLMPDLQAAGYLPLCPKLLEKQGRLKAMCQAFERLIEETLVPLALLDAIHVDLRAGYLETANVLCHKDDLTMRLIDLDSLMKFDQLSHLLKDPRIISPKNGSFAARIYCAVEFVCLQAVCVATAWLKGKQMDTTTDEDVRSALEEDLDTEKMIEKYLVKTVGNTDVVARSAFFSVPDNEACTFVLRQVRPILEELLGESLD